MMMIKEMTPTSTTITTVIVMNVMLLWGQALSKITSTGAMTYCFIQAIERGHASTYGSMLNSMRSVLRSTGSSNDLGGGVVTSLLTMLLTGGSTLSGGLRQVFVPWCYI
jgi:hypothetical protein